MKISDETARNLHKAGQAAREFLEWGAPKAGVLTAIWFGGAAILGGIGSLSQGDIHDTQYDKIKDMRYMPGDSSGGCVVVDPEKEQIVTVKGHQNSLFTQALRAATPFIDMTEGERVVLGKTPAYAAVPCSVIKEGVTTYENAISARAAEYANSRALLGNLRKAQEAFNRTEDLTFTVQPKEYSQKSGYQAPQL